MKRVSLHAAAAGLLLALAVSGLASLAAAKHEQVFIQPNIAVPLGSSCGFDGDCRSADLLCDPVSGCTLAENRICSVDLDCFGPYVCLTDTTTRPGTSTCRCCGPHLAVLNPDDIRFG